jgi:DNA-binding transcriptional LysR family regulator
MDLRQLEYFCAITDAGSFSAAARTLLIAQPTLTVAMRNLERELGTALLVRASPGVSPTEAGQYLYHEAQRILRDITNTTRHVRSIAQGLAGNLDLAVIPSYSWAHLADVLGAVSAAAPGIQVRLSDPPPVEILQQVSDGTSDLGVVVTHDPLLLRERYGELRLRFRSLCELPVVAVLPPSFAAAPNPIPLDTLQEQAWVIPTTPPRFPGMAALTELVWRNNGWTPHTVREVSTSQASLPMIAGGLGVALMPSSLGVLAEGSVVLRRLREQVPPLVAVGVWHSDRAVKPALATLLRVLEQHHGEFVMRTD